MASPVLLKRSIIAFLGLTAVACAKDPWAYPGRPTKSVGSEVFRVFCKRAVRASTPHDLEGTSFDAACLGEGDLPEPDAKVKADKNLEEERARLEALLKRREDIVGVIDRILGDDTVTQKKLVTILEPDELRTFLRELVPLYDKPQEELPGTTRTLASVLYRLVDDKDKTGNDILKALSQVNGRQGYRKLDLALGLLRPLLEYPDLDAFAENGLKAIAHGGVAEKSLDEMSLGLALEMANYDPTPPEPDSTLIIARDLLLSPIDQLDQPEREAVYVTKRDKRGVAIPFGATDKSLPAPFIDDDADGLADVDAHGRFLSDGELVTLPGPYRVAGESKDTARDDVGRALNSWDGNKQLYADFDAQPTLAAAMLRETKRMATPAKAGDRTSLEKIGRGMSTLFGLSSKRSLTYGKAKVEYTGPDPKLGAAYDLVHAVAAAVRTNPDVMRRTVELLKQGMIQHEPEMAQFVETLVNISERGDEHPEAVAVGEMGPGTPHRFWDDLIKIGVRMTDRPGMVEALIRWITTPEAQAATEIFADWMQYQDVTKYKNADFKPGDMRGVFTPAQWKDLNAPATTTYQTEVDRTQPSVGPNRSVWQQTMSMVHNLNQGICNKDHAVLHLIVSCDPSLQPASPALPSQPIACAVGSIQDYPWTGMGYNKCDLFEVPHMIRIWVQSILGEGVIELKPADFNTGVYQIFGVQVDVVQELETQVLGFNKSPTPTSFARFLYGPPNQFTQKMKPDVLRDGAKIEEIDPYALFAMEVKHKSAGDMSFLEAGKGLVEIFERHELTKPGKHPVTGADVPGALLKEGYLFADMLDVFHMHWGSRTDEPCTGVPACTQHADPKAPFFSYQTDLRSYEPLLMEVFRDDKLVKTLADATKALDSIQIDGKSGIVILSEFAELMLKPQKDLTYRDGTPSAKNNVGDDLGYVSPLYLFLDGLKRIDQNFAADENKGRQDVWKEARSEVVDLFLTVEEADGKKRLQDRIGRSIFVRVLDFLTTRIDAHQDAKDIEDWTNNLAPRAVTFFDTPLVAGLLHLFDQSWDEPAAGRELMKFIAYLVDEDKNPVGFETTLVAVADLLQLLENSQQIAPILDLASEAATPGVQTAVDEKGGSDFDPNKGLLRRLVELQNHLLQLHKRRPSTLSRVAGNLVRTAGNEDQTPLEALIDVITEVERKDASLPVTALLEAEDFRLIATSVHEFISDDGHGVERLYAVIQNRTISPPKAQDQQ
ncbi:MAG: hypothetical protein QM778_30020 [Myxococcales bacterium]